MKRICLMVVFLSFLLMVGCGGGGDGENCDFDISDFTNGSDAQSATSYWSCRAGGTTYDLAFYDDETGFSTSNVGAFTWQETGCRQVHASSALGGITITDIEGSVASGIATFNQVFDSTGDELDNSCTLVQGAAAQLMGDYDFELGLDKLLEYTEEN